jgi:hypothetical protein
VGWAATTARRWSKSVGETRCGGAAGDKADRAMPMSIELNLPEPGSRSDYPPLNRRQLR